MDNNSNSFNPVSGADSASVQEQLVKGSLSSSNFNIVDEWHVAGLVHLQLLRGFCGRLPMAAP